MSKVAKFGSAGGSEEPMRNEISGYSDATARAGCSTPKASPMISATPCSAYSRMTRS
ncbi:hypothetical protein D3C87_2063240 [compost metagenome]